MSELQLVNAPKVAPDVKLALLVKPGFKSALRRDLNTGRGGYSMTMDARFFTTKRAMHSAGCAFASGNAFGATSSFTAPFQRCRGRVLHRHAQPAPRCRIVTSDASSVDFPPGSVALVGAGPGAGDLITLRGVALLSQADVIVHDRLGCTAALQHARPPADLIPVGKGRGVGTGSQKIICDELVRQATAGNRVVRLKGGDPLTFGRGGEELEHLRDLDIAVQVCPGVTAAAGAAAAVEVPLTHKGVSKGVRFVTAHEAGKGIGMAEEGETIVLYMALQELGEAVERLVEAGVKASTPVVAVMDATLPTEREVWSCVGRVAGDVKEAGLVSPTIVVVGDAVGLSPGWVAWAGRMLVADESKP